MSLNIFRIASRRTFSIASCLSTKGDMGSGVGRGGGSGGSIREAGGKFGEIEAASENMYFRKLEAQQLEALRKKHDEEIEHHEQEIQRHLDAIKRHREHKDSLKNKDKKDD